MPARRVQRNPHGEPEAENCDECDEENSCFDSEGEDYSPSHGTASGDESDIPFDGIEDDEMAPIDDESDGSACS